MNLKMKNETSMKRIQPSKVTKHLQTEILGHPILYFLELTSTNDVAKELALRGAKEGTVVLAETQISGRGRLERKWISPEGGLWFSIVLRPTISSRDAPKLTLMASVAVARTINKLSAVGAEIKWPNDVLINQKKVCGILTEAELKDETLDFVVIGIGINADFDLNALPRYIKDYSTTLREESGEEIDRETLLCTLLEKTESYYALFKERKFYAILKEWRSLTSFLGSYVKIVSGEEKIEGMALNIDEDGALMLRQSDKTLRKVTVGDLTVIGEDYPKWIDE
jgi:BirA family biotin operon repressor/biotin-[acetyl-CoA-carboxylase] ligase